MDDRECVRQTRWVMETWMREVAETRWMIRQTRWMDRADTMDDGRQTRWMIEGKADTMDDGERVEGRLMENRTLSCLLVGLFICLVLVCFFNFSLSLLFACLCVRF